MSLHGIQFAAELAKGYQGAVFRFWDICHRYLPIEEANAQGLKAIHAFFSEADLGRRGDIFGWEGETGYILRLTHIRRKLEAHGFVSTQSPYKDYAGVVLKGMITSRKLADMGPEPSSSDPISYSYPAPACECTECKSVLRDFLSDPTRTVVQHIGNAAGRKHLTEMAEKAGRVTHTVTKPHTRLLLTITKTVRMGSCSQWEVRADTLSSVSHLHTQSAYDSIKPK